MRTALSRPVLLAVALAAIAALVALTAPRVADAQPATFVSVFTFQVEASNGHTTLPEYSGSGDGVLAVSCGGAWPRTGPRIPASVVTELRPDLTYLRILGPTQAGKAQAGVTGTVEVTCVFEIEAGAAAAQAAAAR